MTTRSLNRQDWTTFLGEVPAIAWVLVGVAAIDLVVHANGQGLIGPGADVEPAAVIRALAAASSFLLAAAIVIGADRWPAGRSFLIWGAGAFVLHGLMELGWQAWLTWWLGANPQALSDGEQTALVVRTSISTVAAAAAWVLVAVGIWVARPSRSTIGRGRMAAIVAIGALGLVATGAELALAGQGVGPGAERLWLLTAVLYALVALGSAASAALAIAALRGMPIRDGLPELLLAGGAALMLAGAAWSRTFLALTDISQSTLEAVAWNFTLPSAVGLLGTLLLIAGFASGRLFPHPDA